MYIVLVGAPGSGKGYLTQGLIEEFKLQKGLTEADILVIATGDLIREEIAKKSVLGQEIEQTVNSGGLVSDSTVLALLKNKLESANQKVVIIDGYPRTKEQAFELQKLLPTDGVYVLYRNTSPETIFERVKDRRICENCKTIHTAQDGSCPKCGGKSVIRKDDAAIKARLNAFSEYTIPAIAEMKRMYGLDFHEYKGSIDGKLVAKSFVPIAGE